MSVTAILNRLGLSDSNSGACGADWIASPGGGDLVSLNPATGEPLARVMMASEADYERVIDDSCAIFARWRALPAPKRGEIVRQIGESPPPQDDPAPRLAGDG